MQRLLILGICFSLSSAATKDLLFAPDSNNQTPLRYDLMKELPSPTTAKPYAPRFGKAVVRPALSSLVDSFKEKSKLRKVPGVLPEPRRKLYSTYVPRIVEDNRVARVERAFDRVVGFVDLVGKLDSFISDRAKLAVRKLSAMYSEEERYKRGH